MVDSILESMKSKLGVSYDEYDEDLIIEINTALAALTIAGVGPKSGFVIEDATKTWSQLTVDKTTQALCKQYVWTRCRITFDPPTNSFVLQSLQDTAKDLLYQINLKVDCPPADRDGIWEDV